MTHEGLTILPVFIGMNVPKLYMSTGLQICLSQRPLRWACTEGLNRQDQRHHFSVSKNVVVFLYQVPPQQGGPAVAAHRKVRKPVKNFRTAFTPGSAVPLIS